MEETAELPALTVQERKEPETDGFRKFRMTWGDRAIGLILAGALILAGMVIRHEMTLKEINIKLGFIMKALKVEP